MRGDSTTLAATRSGKRYIESSLSGDVYFVESTLWHDGRVRVMVAHQEVPFFAFSFYPAIVNPSEPQDAVYIELGANFISSREPGATTSVTVDDR